MGLAVLAFFLLAFMTGLALMTGTSAHPFAPSEPVAKRPRSTDLAINPTGPLPTGMVGLVTIGAGPTGTVPRTPVPVSATSADDSDDAGSSPTEPEAPAMTTAGVGQTPVTSSQPGGAGTAAYSSPISSSATSSAPASFPAPFTTAPWWCPGCPH